MPTDRSVSKSRYQWAAPGDVNAFFGLMLDNVANLLLTVSLLAIVFAFPAKFLHTKINGLVNAHGDIGGHTGQSGIATRLRC